MTVQMWRTETVQSDSELKPKDLIIVDSYDCKDDYDVDENVRV
jgi:hypothetical protein